MYDIRNIWKKQPVAIAGAIKSLLHVGVLAGVISFGEPLLAGISLAIEVTLGLFVWNAVEPTKEHEDG